MNKVKVTQPCPTLCHPTEPSRLFCPWNSPGKNTGVGCHSLLQGIFLTQGSNLVLSYCRQILYHLSYQWSPLTQNSLLNHSGCTSAWIAFHTNGRPLELQALFLVCLIAWLLYADKEEFTQFYFLRKKIQHDIEITLPNSSLLGQLSFFFPCPLLFQPLPFFCCLRRDWGQEKKGTTEDEMAGWHHWLDGHEFEWTLEVDDGQGGLACCNSWGCKELDMTEWLNWTERHIETAGKLEGGGESLKHLQVGPEVMW